jgi:hypothetical protein
MSVGQVVVEDPDPNNNGFFTKRYIRILVEPIPGQNGWTWIETDPSEAHIMRGGRLYPTELDAEHAAASHFGGGFWAD